jgi:SWI/SNF-related matrix-associated actin-dependent regulator of chromatin subfamily A3
MFRKFIVSPLEDGEDGRQLTTSRLCALIDSACIRRMRNLIKLPQQKEQTRLVELSQEEREQYESTQTIMYRHIKQLVGEFDKNRIFGTFQAWQQLRILCNHGTFQHKFSWAKGSILNEREDALSVIGQSEEGRCSCCRQTMPIFSSSATSQEYLENCGHVLCSDCLSEKSNGARQPDVGRPSCPLCILLRAPMIAPDSEDTYVSKSGHEDSYFLPSGHSSKMTALISDVLEGLLDNKRSVALVEALLYSILIPVSVIFSCWTRTLDLIENSLIKNSIRFERIDGECSVPRRQQILDDFESNPHIPVLIMTTGTGAYG